MEPYQQRVVDEKADLDVSLERLKAFIGTGRFDLLGADERRRLKHQAICMIGYSSVLGERIANFQP